MNKDERTLAERKRATDRFEQDIPRTLNQMLQGGTTMAGCAEHMMKVDGDRIVISRSVAQWVLDRLNGHRR